MTAVTGVAVPIGTVEDAPAQIRRVVEGCQSQGQLEEFGRGGSRSPRIDARRRRFDDCGNLATSPRRRERKVSRSFLSVRHECSQAGVNYASLGRCGTRHHSGTQERMHEAETLILDLDDPRFERLGESGFRASAGGFLDEAHRRFGEQGNDPGNLGAGSPESIEAVLNQVCEIRGDWQLRARIQMAAPASLLKRAHQLERKERIPARRLPDAEKRWPGKDIAAARS